MTRQAYTLATVAWASRAGVDLAALGAAGVDWPAIQDLPHPELLRRTIAALLTLNDLQLSRLREFIAVMERA